MRGRVSVKQAYQSMKVYWFDNNNRQNDRLVLSKNDERDANEKTRPLAVDAPAKRCASAGPVRAAPLRKSTAATSSARLRPKRL